MVLLVALLLKCYAEGDPTAVTRFDVRFSRPVFPGDTLRFDFWKEGEGAASFRATVIERDGQTLDEVALNNGYVEFKV